MRRPRPRSRAIEVHAHHVGWISKGDNADIAGEDKILVNVRYWDDWARAALVVAKQKWLFAFNVKGQYQPALDMVNQTIYGFQQEREACALVLQNAKYWGWPDVPAGAGIVDYATWGAADLASSYDSEAAKMIGVLITIQTDLHKGLTLSQIAIKLPPQQQYGLQSPSSLQARYRR